MFKSYYVVWKQEDTTFRISAIGSLNRTMQYGNKYKIKQDEKYKEV